MDVLEVLRATRDKAATNWCGGGNWSSGPDDGCVAQLFTQVAGGTT